MSEDLVHQPASAEVPAARDSGPVQSGLPEARDGWDKALMIGGVLGMLASLGGVAIMATLTVISLLSEDGSDPLLPGIQGVSLLAVGALGAPAIYWGAVGNRNRGLKRPWPAWIAALAIFPVALSVGVLAFENGVLPGILGPAAHLLAAGAPVLFVASMVVRRSALISARRRWGHFLAGLWLTPPLSLFLELVSLIPTGLLVVAALSLTPQGLEVLSAFGESELATESEAIELARRVLSQPAVIVVLVGFISGVVPAIEEALKSMAIWPLLRRPLSNGQAFLGGALGGAGYAFFESLFLPQPGEDWMITMLARTGTPLIHAFCAGIVALGLVEAIQARRWIKLVLLYPAAMALHGLWNFFAIGLGLSGFAVDARSGVLNSQLLDTLAYVGLLGLFGLTALSLAGLVWLPPRLADRPRRM